MNDYSVLLYRQREWVYKLCVLTWPTKKTQKNGQCKEAFGSIVIISNLPAV